MKKPVTFDHPSFPQRFILMLSMTCNQVNDWLRDNKFTMGVDIEGCHGMVFQIDAVIFIWLASSKKDDVNLSFLVHETKHALSLMMIRLGMKPDLHNDEFESYTQQWIFSQCIKKLK